MIGEYKDDSKAFVFTLKNPHGVEPTRFMKKVNSQYAIECNPKYGPIFGNEKKYCSDILIDNNCNEENSCYIEDNGKNAYNCHPQHKKSLFVGTDGPDYRNFFTVLDYEVYTHH